MLTIPLALVAALVAQDQVPLRAAAHDTAPRQALLFRGDWLEVRGEHQGFLKVYDHRRERPGYVRPTHVRVYPVEPASGPALLAVIEFLKDTPGAESLGIGLVALYLQAADPKTVGSAPFDALGTFAERLGRRASERRPGSSDSTIASHLEVAESYGVHFRAIETDKGTQICYDGEALRQVLALPSTAEERARAALMLTRPGCNDPDRSIAEVREVTKWQLEVLERVGGKVGLVLGNRLRLRRATLEAQAAFDSARTGDREQAHASGERAVAALASIERTELPDEDLLWYEEVAVRVAASRWSTETERAPRLGLGVETAAGKPGETCVRLVERTGDKSTQLDERCTYGVVWAASARSSSRGQALAISIQPLAGWAELWVWRKRAEGWQVDTLPPAPIDPDLGYVELCGFSPDGEHLLVVKEARREARMTREFAVLRTDTLIVEKQAHNPQALASFKKWPSSEWRGRTLALR